MSLSWFKLRCSFCTSALIIVALSPSFAQIDVKYFEIIKEDSVWFFLKTGGIFEASRTVYTGQECADGSRVARLTPEGKFHGSVLDTRYDKKEGDVILLQGYYNQGAKHGKFTFYNYDGLKVAEGHFEHDVPVGIWSYFSETGSTIMQLRFVAGIPYVDFVANSSTNSKMVESGNGEAIFLSRGDIPYIVKGRVKDGMPDGEWVGELEIWRNGKIIKQKRKEHFTDGKLISTTIDDGQKTTKLCCESEFNKFYMIPEIKDCIALEQFPIKPCPKVSEQGTSSSQANRPFLKTQPTIDLGMFKSDLKSIIQRKYEETLVGESTNRIGLDDEENKLVIRFDSDENGKPTNIKMVSGFGREFFQSIRSSLFRYTRWQPSQEEIFLNVFIRMGRQTYGYRISFTAN